MTFQSFQTDFRKGKWRQTATTIIDETVCHVAFSGLCFSQYSKSNYCFYSTSLSVYLQKQQGRLNCIARNPFVAPHPGVSKIRDVKNDSQYFFFRKLFIVGSGSVGFGYIILTQSAARPQLCTQLVFTLWRFCTVGQRILSRLNLFGFSQRLRAHLFFRQFLLTVQFKIFS